MYDEPVVAAQFLRVVALGWVELPGAKLGQDQLIVGLRSGAYGDLLGAIDCFDLDLRAKDSLNE